MFYGILFVVAAGSVSAESFLGAFVCGPFLNDVCSLAFYVAIPVATQFPHLLFFNVNLHPTVDNASAPHSSLSFAFAVAGFWATIVLVLACQLAWSNAESNALKAIARWVLLVGLAIFFSATDYAVPSYRRYLRLLEEGKWGPKARVMRGA